MSGKFFLDTNILVYTFDATAPAKQQIARELVSTALNLQKGIICQTASNFDPPSASKIDPPNTG